MKKKRVKVMSPKLKALYGDLVSRGPHDRFYHYWFCLGILRCLVGVPDAKYYWVEASTHQWLDGSGTQVCICIRKECVCDDAEPIIKIGSCTRPMFSAVMPKMRKLGVKEDGEYKTIYFRLWYED